MSEREALWEKASKFRTCMLVTRTGDGMRARPMAPIIDRQAGDIRFLISKLDLKDGEISVDSDVCLTFGGEDEFISISGKAEQTRDHGVIVSLWGPEAEPYFERGLDDVNLVAVIVRPEQAQIWQGAKTVATLFGTTNQAPVAKSIDLAEQKAETPGETQG